MSRVLRAMWHCDVPGCGHEWRDQGKHPAQCPWCRSRKWNTATGEVGSLLNPRPVSSGDSKLTHSLSTPDSTDKVLTYEKDEFAS